MWSRTWSALGRETDHVRKVGVKRERFLRSQAEQHTVERP
jgi:hypothetical protein